jgi:folate-binding protein YgfZ
MSDDRPPLDRTPLAVAAEAATSMAEDLGVAVAADYGDPATEERAFREGAALVDRSARGAVLVEGPEGLKFLQSLLSADIEP